MGKLKYIHNKSNTNNQFFKELMKDKSITIYNRLYIKYIIQDEFMLVEFKPTQSNLLDNGISYLHGYHQD